MIRGPLQTLPQATAASATALVASNAQHVELADQITEYGRAVAGHFSSSVARSSVAAGKWFLQRLDGEKPDVFCHATQLMHGADSLPVGQRVRFDLASNVRRAATHAVKCGRPDVRRRAGFSAKGQTQSSATLLCRTYCPWYATAKPFAPDGAEGRAVVRQ